MYYNRRSSTLLELGAVFAVTFTLAFIIGSLTFIPHGTSAEDSAGVVAEIAEVLSLTTSTAQADFGVAPTIAGQQGASDFSITVSTNHITGYTLTMSSSTANTALAHTSGGYSIPSTTKITPAALSNNTWGYNIGPSATTFQSIPPATIPAIIKTSPGPVTDQTTSITLGVRVDMSAMVGTYTGSLVFAAVTNPVPVPTIASVSPKTVFAGDTLTILGTNFVNLTAVTIGGTACTSYSVISATQITCVLPDKPTGLYDIVVRTAVGVSKENISVVYQGTMQDFSSALCSALTIYTDQNPVELFLRDSRDDKLYRIRKLSDDNCWMVDNLAIVGPLTLDSTNSDLPPEVAYVLPEVDNDLVGDPNDPLSGSLEYCGTLDPAEFAHKCGMHYQWSVAVADYETEPSDMGIAPQSICPKNWRLPTHYATLLYVYDWYSGMDVVDSPWRGLYAGYNGAYSVGEFGYYWTATYNSSTQADQFYFNSRSSYPDNSDTRTYAQSLRCIAN